jgi:hypothetical protein
VRRRQPQVAAPERLVRFVPAEWPGLDLWAAYAAWKRARAEWMDANYPRGAVGPLGDRLNMLRGERETRRRLLGFPT